MKAISLKGISSIAAEDFQPRGTGHHRQWNLRQRDCLSQPLLHRGLTPTHTTRRSSFTRPAEAWHSEVMFKGLSGMCWGRPCFPEGTLNTPEGGQVQVWKCERSSALQSSRRSSQSAAWKSTEVLDVLECSRCSRMFSIFPNVLDVPEYSRCFQNGTSRCSRTSSGSSFEKFGEDRLRRFLAKHFQSVGSAFEGGC